MKSDQCPAPSTNPNAADFLMLVNRNLEKLKTQTKTHIKLNDKEAQALEKLSQNNLITIKSADKGGKIVVFDYEKYISLRVTKFLETRIGIGGSRQT